MKRFKQLIWEDFHKKGLIDLKSWGPAEGIEYFITNINNSSTLFLQGGLEDFKKEIKNIEEGKKLAQEDFEKYIMETFFEQD